MRGKVLAGYVHGAHKEIGILGVNYDGFHALQYCQVDGFTCLITEFHQYRSCGFTHSMRTQNTGTQGGYAQTESILMAILVLHK